MDRCNLESDSRMRKEKSGLHALLRGDFCRTIPGCPGPSLRGGFRDKVGPRKTVRTSTVVLVEDGVCQFDERSFPGWSAGRLRRRCYRNDDSCRLAYLSGSDKAGR